MSRRRLDKQLSRGPWDSAQITAQLQRVGYRQVRGGKHPNYEHPDRPGKVQIPSNWTGVKVGSYPFKGLATQTGLGKKGLQRVLNGLDP